MVACAAAILVIGVMPEMAVRFANAGLPNIERPTAEVDQTLINPANLIHAR
jgi:hypothetical protein